MFGQETVSGVKLEEQETFANRLRRQKKDSSQRIQELEEELEGEYLVRQKSDRLKCDLQRELAETTERLEEQAGATQAQVEVNKKRELEVVKLRRELEELNINQENTLVVLRMENNNTVTGLSDELDKLRMAKSQLDKECAEIRNQLENINSVLDVERKRRLDQERSIKTVDIEMSELQKKCDDQMRQVCFHLLCTNLQEN